jgi:peptidoglycan/xylan/chitin deacetylase (PgdA/CDA1 family)
MRFSRPLHRASFASGLSTLLARLRPSRRILMLHGVEDPEMPADDFARGVEWLKRRMPIVPLARMVDDIAAARPVPAGGEIALTFDDGLRNQYEFAYPVLERLEAPATFFICPTLMDERRWLWTQEARSRLESLDGAGRHEYAAAIGLATDVAEAIVVHMKTLPIAERLRREEALRERTPGFGPTAETKRRFDLLSWDDVARLDPALVTIGSHTLTHPILTSIDDETLEREIGESRRLLEERLGRTVDLFCYPNGSMDERVRAVVGRAYRAAVTTENGFVAARPDMHRLHRIPATPHLPLLAWRMHRPSA